MADSLHEDGSVVVSLKHVDVDTFGRFVEWPYSGYYTPTIKQNIARHRSSDEDTESEDGNASEDRREEQIRKQHLQHMAQLPI